MGRRAQSAGWIVSCGFLGLISISPTWADDALAKPIIGINPSSVDFGTVKEGTVLTKEFLITNSGSAPLGVSKAIPSCGCTTTLVSADSIPPGGQGSIKVELDTAGFSGDKIKTVDVVSTDPVTPVTKLTLKARVENDITIEPKYLFFGDLGPDDLLITKKEVKIRVNPDRPARILSVKSFSKNLIIQDSGNQTKERIITVQISPDAAIGEIRDRVIVTLAEAGQPAVNIPVFAALRGAIRLVPSALSFGVVTGQEPVTRIVRVESEKRQPLSFKEVISSSDLIKAELKPVLKGKAFNLQVTVDSKDVKKEFRETVTLVVQDEQETKVTLNVYGTIPPKF